MHRHSFSFDWVSFVAFDYGSRKNCSDLKHKNKAQIHVELLLTNKNHDTM